MAVNDIVKLTLHSNYHGSRLQSSMHFAFETVGASNAGLVADFQANAQPSIEAATVGEMVYTQYTVEQVAAGVPPSTAGPFAASTVHPLAAGTTGDLVGEGMVGQAPAVLSIRTALKGKRYRGRVFFSGAPEASQALGLWSAAQLALWQAIATALQNRYASGGLAEYTLGVWSPADPNFRNKAGVLVPRVGNIFTAASSVVANSAVKTLRRRALGAGR